MACLAIALCGACEPRLDDEASSASAVEGVPATFNRVIEIVNATGSPLIMQGTRTADGVTRRGHAANVSGGQGFEYRTDRAAEILILDGLRPSVVVSRATHELTDGQRLRFLVIRTADGLRLQPVTELPPATRWHIGGSPPPGYVPPPYEGSGGGTCFVAGTLVDTPRGRVPIETLRPGHLVLTLDNGRHKVVPGRVEQTFRFEQRAVGTLRLADGSELRPTPDHPFYSATRRTWVNAGELQPGEEVLALDRGHHFAPVAVEGYELESAPQTVYNLTVTRHHTYFADGIFVHNRNLGDPDADLPIYYDEPDAGPTWPVGTEDPWAGEPMPPPEEPYCGNEYCDWGEDCEWCEYDCGPCW